MPDATGFYLFIYFTCHIIFSEKATEIPTEM